MVFIGFSNVSELLVKKTLETNKNNEFLIFLHHNLKIMFFLFLLAVPMFLSSWSWFFMVFFYGFLQ